MKTLGLRNLEASGLLPRWRQSAGHGIVHLGLGAFHRAHQAPATQDALQAQPGDWLITAVSLRSTALAHGLGAQDGLYTLVERDDDQSRTRLLAAIGSTLAERSQPGATLLRIAAAETRIVSLTVTEKAYGFAPVGGVDPENPEIRADLARPDRPVGVIGLLVAGLAARRAAGLAPFTVLCCDNLSENGLRLRTAVMDFADRIDPALAGWIGDSVAFPSTMVDRITPIPGPALAAEVARLTGLLDACAVETEAFSQWVIEDCFPQGRPAWEAAPGVIFVRDAAPFEKMKLGMLNGSHSLIAWAGQVAGIDSVGAAMTRPEVVRLLRGHMARVAAGLGPLAGIDTAAYADSLLRRFANRAIHHRTAQIAMDGTQKLGPRVFEPAVAALAGGRDLASFAWIAAAWMRHCLGVADDGAAYDLNDPRRGEIAAATARARAAAPAEDHTALATALERQLSALPGLVPAELAASADWRNRLRDALAGMLAEGMDESLRKAALRFG
ncbi:MAG: mannitol dehydrogenase family protein [Rhodobacteraceae bacterium]|jgi:fructuronate reductase|nr:mannitol dehydrogenase family protein [Paracoccaceae bacterium]